MSDVMVNLTHNWLKHCSVHTYVRVCACVCICVCAGVWVHVCM